MALGVGDLINAIIGIGGSVYANSSREDAAQAAIDAGRPLDVKFPGGEVDFSKGALKGKLSPALQQQLKELQKQTRRAGNRLDRFSIGEAEDSALSRFRELTNPTNVRRRAEVTNAQFQRGRLGLGTPQPRTGAFANPELGALAEAEAFQDSLMSQQAVDFARQEEARLINNYFTALTGQQQLAGFPLSQAGIGIGASANPALAQLAGASGFSQANSIDAFVAALGKDIGQRVQGAFSRNTQPGFDFIGLRGHEGRF